MKDKAKMEKNILPTRRELVVAYVINSLIVLTSIAIIVMATIIYDTSSILNERLAATVSFGFIAFIMLLAHMVFRHLGDIIDILESIKNRWYLDEE
jgi:TRAP-type C4-dicarboxylate transport system permease small subunit